MSIFKHVFSTRIIASVFALGFSITTMAELVVEDGFVRNPIPGRTMSAAFMEIHNASNSDVILTHATLEGAKSVEMHTHTHEEGVMRMRQIFKLSIKAGESVILEPGGLHLMVFGIIKLPENPKLVLCTADNTCYTTTIATRSLVNKD